jgi:hypothetical protein
VTTTRIVIGGNARPRRPVNHLALPRRTSQASLRPWRAGPGVALGESADSTAANRCSVRSGYNSVFRLCTNHYWNRRPRALVWTVVQGLNGSSKVQTPRVPARTAHCTTRRCGSAALARDLGGNA